MGNDLVQRIDNLTGRRKADSDTLQGRPMSAKAPVANNFLGWNATTRKWEPSTVGAISIATATVDLTLTTTAQSITGDGNSSKVRLLLAVGTWLVEATCDFYISAGGTDALIGQLHVNDSATPETAKAILYATDADRGTVHQAWRIVITANNTPIELKAWKNVAGGVGQVMSVNTTLTATTAGNPGAGHDHALLINLGFSVSGHAGPLGLTQHGDVSGDALTKHAMAQISGVITAAQHGSPAGDLHTGYALLAGRTGTTNDLILTTSAGPGTLYGSSNAAGTLTLKANSTDANGVLVLAGDTPHAALTGNMTISGTLGVTGLLTASGHVRLAANGQIQDSAGTARLTVATTNPEVILTGRVAVSSQLAVGDTGALGTAVRVIVYGFMSPSILNQNVLAINLNSLVRTAIGGTLSGFAFESGIDLNGFNCDQVFGVFSNIAVIDGLGTAVLTDYGAIAAQHNCGITGTFGAAVLVFGPIGDGTVGAGIRIKDQSAAANFGTAIALAIDAQSGSGGADLSMRVLGTISPSIHQPALALGTTAVPLAVFDVVGGTFAPAVGALGRVARVSGTLTEAASGTHARMMGLEITAPVITAGLAASTVGVSLYIDAAPTGPTTNYALWVDAGNLRIDDKMSVGTAGVPTAKLHLGAGSAAAATAPMKLNSGALMTVAEAGAVEFLTDKAYLTITTGAARKEIALNDAALTSGRIPAATTNGRLTDGPTPAADGTTTPVNSITISKGLVTAIS